MRLRSLAVTLLLVAYALPAAAQRTEVRDHRKGKKDDKSAVVPSRAVGRQGITVSGFVPQSGPVGTVVTVNGSGFTPQTKVIFGGRPVKRTDVQPSFIKFAVPARYGDGLIVLRHPGVANDVVAGTFTVDADPQIVRFAPTSGPIGTRVEISGAGFKNGDQLLFNGKALAIAELSAARIVAVIPPGATSDFFVVARPGRPQARTRVQFKVTLPPPTIASFAPTSGPPGTVVRVTGSGFAAEDQLYFGGARMAPLNRAEGFMEFAVPMNARVNQAITVRGPRGSATTAQPFAVVLPPVFRGFKPFWGPPGTQIEVRGAHFLRGDELRMNGRPMKILKLEENVILAEVAADARTDVLAVFRGGVQVAAARRPFEVVVPPRITAFAPTGGPAGTRVTITGTGFSPDTTVLYGVQSLRAVARNADTSIDVILPRNATNQRFTVRTRGGEASTAAPFQVFVYSFVTGITPTSGPVGTRVWIRGRAFNPTDVFYLNNLTLPIVERQPEGYQVQIPAGATSGVIEWESYGRREKSRFSFQVLLKPEVASFTPTSGPTGTQITIAGANFTAGAAVFYGSVPCTVLRRLPPSQLVVVVPPSAQGTDYLWVEDGGQRVRSAQTFQVIAPPVLTAFTPVSGPTGTHITITGANFTNTSVPLYGSMPMTVVRRQLPGQIVATIPADARGEDYVWVEDRGQKVKSAGRFVVITPPVVTGIAPAMGPAGTQVVISGDQMSPRAVVWFGTLSCPIISRSGIKQIVVKIPAGAHGRAPLVVEDRGQRVQSAQLFEVREPAAPPPPPDTAGHHEHAHQHPHQAGDHHHHPHAHPHRQGTNHHHPF